MRWRGISRTDFTPGENQMAGRVMFKTSAQQERIDIVGRQNAEQSMPLEQLPFLGGGQRAHPAPL